MHPQKSKRTRMINRKRESKTVTRPHHFKLKIKVNILLIAINRLKIKRHHFSSRFERCQREKIVGSNPKANASLLIKRVYKNHHKVCRMCLTKLSLISQSKQRSGRVKSSRCRVQSWACAKRSTC